MGKEEFGSFEKFESRVIVGETGSDDLSPPPKDDRSRERKGKIWPPFFTSK